MMLHSIFAWIAGSERHIFNLRNVQMALILGSVLNKISSVSYVKKKKKIWYRYSDEYKFM